MEVKQDSYQVASLRTLINSLGLVIDCLNNDEYHEHESCKQDLTDVSFELLELVEQIK